MRCILYIFFIQLSYFCSSQDTIHMKVDFDGRDYSFARNSIEKSKTDTTTIHIVILGSSTAAGTGPSSVDSAWVWLYEDFLFQKDARFEMTNLAKGGFTTYNILPNETIIADGLSFTIDTARNITKALSLQPDAIIINLPSNDAAKSVPVDDQIQNYNVILSGLEERKIPYWICTPQPRNGFNASQQKIQAELLESTIDIFENNYIDFWTGLATDDGEVIELYDSGDGVHLNNSAHKILLQRVIDMNIDSILLGKSY